MEENEVKKPFPKIRLNKSNRSNLKQAVQNYLENKYPRISTEKVTWEMERFLNSLVSRQDAQVLKKFGSLHKERRPYCVCRKSENEKSYYFLDEFWFDAVPGSGDLCLYTWELSGNAVPSIRRIPKLSLDHPALVKYAKSCEERSSKIQQEKQAWSNIIDTTVIASRLPEEARPLVEEVFYEYMRQTDSDLEIIRNAEKE